MVKNPTEVHEYSLASPKLTSLQVSERDSAKGNGKAFGAKSGGNENEGAGENERSGDDFSGLAAVFHEQMSRTCCNLITNIIGTTAAA